MTYSLKSRTGENNLHVQLIVNVFSRLQIYRNVYFTVNIVSAHCNMLALLINNYKSQILSIMYLSKCIYSWLHPINI